MKCFGLLIAIFVIVTVLVIFKTMTLIVRYRHNISLWLKRYSIWKFIVRPKICRIKFGAYPR